MKSLCVLALMAAVLVADTAWATGGKQGGTARGLSADKKQIVKFDGDTIDGDLLRPDGDLMAVRPEIAMPSLVVPPSSFDRAARRTILNAADAVATRRAHSSQTGRK